MFIKHISRSVQGEKEDQFTHILRRGCDHKSISRGTRDKESRPRTTWVGNMTIRVLVGVSGWMD